MLNREQQDKSRNLSGRYQFSEMAGAIFRMGQIR
jgi:hypothetical protein